MKVTEIITEDDYYPSYESHKKSAADLEAFVQNYIEEYLGAPHRGSAGKHFDKMAINIQIPRYEIGKARNPRKPERSKKEIEALMKQEWRDTAEDLIGELASNDWGEFELVSLGPFRMELEAPWDLFETTSAGGIATVVGGLAPAITRNASIYGKQKTTKKKKKNKYANSKQD